MEDDTETLSHRYGNGPALCAWSVFACDSAHVTLHKNSQDAFAREHHRDHKYASVLTQRDLR